MAIIANVITPSLDTVGQNTQPVLLLNSGHNFHGRKHLREQYSIRCFPVEHIHPHSVFQVRVVTLPIGECKSTQFIILLPEQMP